MLDSLSPLTRRDLIRGAGAAGAGALIARTAPALAHPVAAEFDVVVVGSGAAGMTAALTAAKRGLRAVVIEKADKFGGSTARSGAGIWIRCNEVLLKAGVPDTLEQARTYLARVVGSDVPRDRQEAFLANGPKVISFILANTPLRFRWMEGYSDYYPELPGGMPNGASIEPEVFDGHLLGDELQHLNPPYLATPDGLVVYGGEYRWLNLALVQPKGIAVAAESVARYAAAALRGEKPLTMGQALAAGLRAGLLTADVPVWLNTPLVDLQRDGAGRVTGVIVRRDGQEEVIAAKHGVILGSGGFEHNLTMRQTYQAAPISADWTVGAASNTGDGIQAGARAGAALDLMDDAWWGPSVPVPGAPYFCLAERTLPGGLFVDGSGQRFVNEAGPYVDVVHKMYERGSNGTHVPAWLIFDQNYRNRYLFKDIPPLLPLPQEWYDAGVAFQRDTVEELAGATGVPAAALKATVERFNGFATTGKDLDFHRGDSVYDRYYGDPGVTPNSTLGALSEAPYYAVKIVPGDLGTKGGVRTDAFARALRPDGSVIEGLYAAGNASAAVMGHSYAGAGSTLGPAMTFGFIAANHLAAHR